MEKDPVELEPGRLGCPDCRHPLVPGPTPYYHRGENLGSFDGIVCEMCGFGLLTERGCGDIGRAVASWSRTPPLHEREEDMKIVYVTTAHKRPVAASPGPAKAEQRSDTCSSEMPLPPLLLTKRVRTSYRMA